MLVDFQTKLPNLSTGKMDPSAKLQGIEPLVLAYNTRVGNIKVANTLTSEQNGVIAENKATHKQVKFEGWTMKDFPDITYKHLIEQGSREALSELSFDKIDDTEEYAVSIKTTLFTNSMVEGRFFSTKDIAFQGLMKETNQLKITQHELSYETVITIPAKAQAEGDLPAQNQVLLSNGSDSNGNSLLAILHNIDNQLMRDSINFSNTEDDFYLNAKYLVGHTHETVHDGSINLLNVVGEIVDGDAGFHG